MLSSLDRAVGTFHVESLTLGNVAGLWVHRLNCLSEQVAASLKSWGPIAGRPVVRLLGVISVDAVQLVPPIRRRPGRERGPCLHPSLEVHLAFGSCLSAFTLRNKRPQPGRLRQQAFVSHRSGRCRSRCCGVCVW